MSKKIFLMGMCLWMMEAMGFAQGVPSPPSFSLKNGSTWVVEIAPPPGRKPLPSIEKETDPARRAFLETMAKTKVVRIDAAYASGVRREKLTYANGSSLERYITQGHVFFIDPKTGEVSRDDAARSGTGAVTGVGKLGEFAWVSPSFYVGQEKFEGRVCDVYKKYKRPKGMEITRNDATDGENAGRSEVSDGLTPAEIAHLAEAPHILATAYVDPQTRMPVGLMTRSELRTYTFSSTPTQVVLPKIFQDALQRYKDGVTRREQRYRTPQ